MTSLGLIALSLISPLLIHAFYISAFRGALYASAFVLLGASFTLWIGDNAVPEISTRRTVLRSTQLLVSCTAIGIVLIVGLFVVLNNRYQQHLQVVATSDSAAQLRMLTYQFADVFNALSLREQEEIVGNLQLSTDIHHFDTVVDQSDPETILDTVHAFTSGQYIYIVTRLNENKSIPFNNSRIHHNGNASKILRVSTSCDAVLNGSNGEVNAGDCKLKIPCTVQLSTCDTNTNRTTDFLMQQWLINDRSWNTERLHMYALPFKSANILDTLNTLTIGIYDYSAVIPPDMPEMPTVYYILNREGTS